MENVKSQYEWINFDPKDMDVGSGYSLEIPVTIRNIQSTKRRFNIRITAEFSQRDDLVEWFIESSLIKAKSVSMSPKDNHPIEEEMDIEPRGVRSSLITLITPKGGYMGDRVTLSFSITSEDGINSFQKDIVLKLVPTIVAIKTTVGNEFAVSRDLERKSERDKEERSAINKDASNEVLAIMSPFEVKGYLFAETMHPDRVSFIAKGIRGYKGMVEGAINLTEIEHYLTPKSVVSGLELGAFVELIDGPFKGEKAKIMSIDTPKEEVTVQLVESMVPIPVTVRAEAIRMLEKKS
ncbi:transcription elongation factor Spt5 [Oxyplasma meridianum]|uniref:Transcription elongation factor Spt5 n=1 Tax=Oxyplasma meridianum TaxID=3073602 RepID=A0AAX4NHD9_9ARCH